jgi:hypothetical protein
VVNDCHGGDLYQDGRRQYARATYRTGSRRQSGRPDPSGGARADPARTLRKDTWWAAAGHGRGGAAGSFIVYSTWAAFQNAHYYAAPYLSPFYSPCISTSCLHSTFGVGLPDVDMPIIGSCRRPS